METHDRQGETKDETQEEEHGDRAQGREREGKRYDREEGTPRNKTQRPDQRSGNIN